MQLDKILKIFNSKEEYESFKSKKTEIYEEVLHQILVPRDVDKEYRLKLDLETFDVFLEVLDTGKITNLNLSLDEEKNINAIKRMIVNHKSEEANIICRTFIDAQPKFFKAFLLDIARYKGVKLTYQKNEDEFGGNWIVVESRHSIERKRPSPEEEFMYSLPVKFILPQKEYMKLMNHLYKKGWVTECLGHNGAWIETWSYQLGRSKDDFIFEKTTEGYQVKLDYKPEYELERKKSSFKYDEFLKKKNQ